MKITGALVYTEQHEFVQKEIYIRDGIFTDRDGFDPCVDATLDASGLRLIPGLVDIHFHGAMGHDFCDADPEGLTAIAQYEAKNGVTAICPATMTYSEEILGKVMDNAADWKNKSLTEYQNKDCADLVGINMEGPFISGKKLGAQNPRYLRLPDVSMFRRLQDRSGGLIKLVDIAPEVIGSMEFIKELAPEVCVSLAHMCAGYDTAVRAFEAGARHMTHLFNAMPGINHREPGPIIAALENNAEVELIADGVHVHPAMVRFVFDTFGADKVILISDSMEATGLPDGQYSLGGQGVTVCGSKAALTSDPATIAGSVTNLFDCMKTAVKEMGVPLEAAVRAVTENPAKAIGVFDRYGSIADGKVASTVLIDHELVVKKVILRGCIIPMR